MIRVVVDTNVLVSAFWSKNGNPASILRFIQAGGIVPCWDYRILREYREVLLRPKFGFNEYEVNDILEQIKKDGISISATPLALSFADESDKKFYEVAKQCEAYLITGNLKHFPKDEFILSPADFLNLYNS